VRYFDGRTYEWVGLSRQPNIISKVCLSNVQANDLCCKALSDAGKFPLFTFGPCCGACFSFREHICSQTVHDVCPTLVS
jgi:hypothetical protein